MRIEKMQPEKERSMRIGADPIARQAGEICSRRIDADQTETAQQPAAQGRVAGDFSSGKETKAVESLVEVEAFTEGSVAPDSSGEIAGFLQDFRDGFDLVRQAGSALRRSVHLRWKPGQHRSHRRLGPG